MENHPVATALATIIVSRDPQRLGAALTESARLRALPPRRWQHRWLARNDECPGHRPGHSRWGGAEGNRTPDLLDANESRYQLRHSPGAPLGDAQTLAAAYWPTARR